MIRETKLSEAQLGSYVLQYLSYTTPPLFSLHTQGLAHARTHTHILRHEHTYSKMSNVPSSPVKVKHPSLAIRYLMIKSHCFFQPHFLHPCHSASKVVSCAPHPGLSGTVPLVRIPSPIQLPRSSSNATMSMMVLGLLL